MPEHTSHKASSGTAKRRGDEELEKISRETEREDLEDETPRHGSKGKKKKKSKKGFPAGGLILMLLLIGVILAAGYFGMEYYEQFKAVKADYEGKVAAAEADLNEARAELDEADPESAAHKAEREQLSGEMIAAAEAEMEKLQAAEQETDSEIRKAEERVKELEGQEDFDYYKAIYDEYVEGGAYVEGLLSGN